MTNPLILYVRAGCHLCEQFLLELSLDFPSCLEMLETLDVDGDADLASEYGLRVPVLVAHGHLACEGLYDRAKVAAALGL